MENQAEIKAENTQREIETAAKPNFDLLSTDSYINGEVPVAAKEEVKEEVKSEKTEEVIESEIKLDEEKSSEEVKEEVKEETKEDVIDENAPLTLDDESASKEERDWIDYAKENGVEITENSPEAYINAKIEPLQKQLAEVENKKLEDLLHNVDPYLRMEVELNQAGYSLQDIKAPLENIAKFKALSDVELYREDLVLRYPNATQEWIDADVEKAVENGQASHDAVRLRLDLDNMEAQIKQEREQIVEKHKANKENNLLQARKAESESVTKALNELSVFMNQPLAPEVKKGLTERFNNGKYDQLMKDPNEIAKFIAYKELGEKAVKSIEAKSYNKGKLEYANKMHNTPPLDKGGASRNQTLQKTGNFELLEDDPNLNS